jgi:FixJ family two-component response regulator
MSTDSPTKVFVVDDSAAVRDSLRWLIESVGHEVEDFVSGAEVLDRLQKAIPACIVLDVRLRGMGGLDVQEELVRRGLSVPVIMITGHGDVPMAVRAMKLGALDFLEKPFSDQLLIDRVQHAIDVGRQARASGVERAEVESRVASLSPREREVMALLAEGKANKEVASILGLSPRTVEGHRARLMDKLGIASLAELVRLQLRVTSPDKRTA